MTREQGRFTLWGALLVVVVIGGMVAVAGDGYTTKIYKTDGGDRLVVDAGGEIEVQSSGAVEVQSGGEIDVETGGALKLAGTAVTATAAELNILDGVTATYAELNILDGATVTYAELNVLDGVTVTTEQLNGITSTLEVYSAAGLAKGDLVYIEGYDVANSAPIALLADADDLAKRAQYVVIETIGAGGTGTVDGVVTISGIDTSAVNTNGDAIYLSATAGAFAASAPTGADQISQVVGSVITKDAAAGSALFWPQTPTLSKIGTDAIQDGAISLAKLSTGMRGDAEIMVGDGSSVNAVAVSGDVTIDSVGKVTIAADAVSNTKLANMTQGTIKVGGTSDAPTDLDANSDGYILVGDGTDVASVAVSGDVTITSTGAVTIAADAVEKTMIAADVAGTGLAQNVDGSLELDSSSGAGTVVGTNGLALAEYGDGVSRQTIFTLTSLAMDVTDTGANGAHGTQQIYDFPAGHIKLIGSTCDLAVTCGTNGLTATATYDVGVGSTAVGTDNAELATTEQDIITKIEGDLSSSAADLHGVNATDLALDGTSSAIDVYLNAAFEADDASANDTCTFTGTVTLTWVNLGDY